MSGTDAGMRIGKVGVIGAGAMGSGIAALVASAGVPVLLLDVPGDQDRDGPARRALERSLKARPAPFMDASQAVIVEVGNTADDLDRLAECDWVVEAIVEQLEPKQALFAQIEGIVGPAAIISSNTSGIPIRLLLDGRSDQFCTRFLGTHFFNPPRYMHLLELVPTGRTSPDVTLAMRTFAERFLGKGVVIAKDVPGFIANRLGLFGMVRTLRLMERFELTIDQVDALTGTLVGRPKSATFRTGDISGLDVLAHVADGMSRTTGEDFSLPTWVHYLIGKGHVGEKAGRGFYTKTGTDILTYDWKRGEYAPQQPAEFPELSFLRERPLAGRLKGLTTAGGAAAEFLRCQLVDTAWYTLQHAPELSPDIVSVDRALEWGYGWERGPFWQYDALGVQFLRSAFEEAKKTEPPLMQVAREGFYRELNSGLRQLTLAGTYAPVDEIPGLIEPAAVRRRLGDVESNDDAALLDLGDGVLLLEFRAKMNTLGPGVFLLLEAAEQRVRHDGFAGLVIGNADPRTFSAGANLSGLLRRAQAGEWAAVDAGVRAFQEGVTSLSRFAFPTVVAPFGLTLGGGAELALYAPLVQAHAELHMGLVEVGVGLVPAGGGTAALLQRFSRDLEAYPEADPFEGVRRAFQLITMGTTSTSAHEAKRLGLLRTSDRVTMNRDRLLAEAKARVLDLAGDYAAPLPVRVRGLGREALGNLEYAVWAMQEARRITAHDALIGKRVALVLSGGDGPPRDLSLQDLLDLEREAFLSLLGTSATQERIAHMLATGRPLRN
ncbi:MAG: putative 3-hydroxyacyl-CoA dehydrogenase [Gemmatimonadaceae bacterium]|nr:putative 3-hydroxyacyl-CoA dehydrogenase [Gemmatimonadaceae bacterium]